MMELFWEAPSIKLFNGDARNLAAIEDRSIDLIITSPPYFNAREYSQWVTYEDYLADLEKVWQECYRVLKEGGRIAVNVCDGFGRQPYTPIGSDVTKQIQALFLLRGNIIWDKGITGGVRQATAWGSWMSASNPYLRDNHEIIIVGSKDDLKHFGQDDDITRDEFLRWTESVWHFGAESAAQIGHPAPFPEELPRRLIKLYSFKNDLVLDPFVGSGTTCKVALDLGRRCIGVDISKKYLEMAVRRCNRLL